MGDTRGLESLLRGGQPQKGWGSLVSGVGREEDEEVGEEGLDPGRYRDPMHGLGREVFISWILIAGVNG